MSILKTNVKQILSIIIVFVLFTANYGIVANAEVTCTIPYAAKVENKQIAVNGYVKYSNELYLYPGDIVYLDFTYTPSNASVWFGIVTPSNKFRYAEGTSGKLQRVITINEEGIHKIKIQNKSTSLITVNGRFSTGCSYPFRGTSIPTAISTSYSTSHSGIDIIDTYPNYVDGREIYSIGNGTVLYEETSDSAGNYVVILYDGGYTARYLHMRSRSSLRKGNIVTYQTFIGYVGSTGLSSGPHLHLDVNTVNGRWNTEFNYNDTINPKNLFPQISFS